MAHLATPDVNFRVDCELVEGSRVTEGAVFEQVKQSCIHIAV